MATHEDLAANRDQYEPGYGETFLATDTGTISLGDGNGWLELTDVLTSADGVGTAHERYTDTEAVAAVNAEDALTVNVTGDAATVGGHAIYVGATAPANPNPDDLWIDTS